MEISETFTAIAVSLINEKYQNYKKQDIWWNSKWKYISELEINDVGRVGGRNY